MDSRQSLCDFGNDVEDNRKQNEPDSRGLDTAIQSNIEMPRFFLDGRVKHGHDKGGGLGRDSIFSHARRRGLRRRKRGPPSIAGFWFNSIARVRPLVPLRFNNPRSSLQGRAIARMKALD